jgi:hypothetical protein
VRNDTATTPAPGVSPADTNFSATQPAEHPVRYDTATTCGYCGTTFVAIGRQRWCCDACRQGAWRARHAAPRPPQPAKADTVYACPLCDARYLGEQRCPECNCWCTRVGPGGPCPHCDGLVALPDIVEETALAPVAAKRAPARRSR